jgi:hypothetical protein
VDERTGQGKMTTGLIINPRAGKQRGDGLALARKLEDASDVMIRVLDNFDMLGPFLEEMAAAGIDALFISSGDGTIQQIQTELAEKPIFAALPVLGLLPHGTTNMTAADIGISSKSIEVQADLVMNASAASNLKRRATVRIANPADGRVRHGMFVGTGAIWRGTVFCQEAVHRTGLRGDWATFATLAVAIAKSMLPGTGTRDEERISRAYEMNIDAAEAPHIDGGQLFFLATTLEKLILGSRPFWGGGTEGVRATVFPYPPPNVPRWLWTTMYGGEDRRMPEGCYSFRSQKIAIETQCPFVIDGEFFQPPRDEPLRIEKGAEFTYVCGP